LVNNVNPKSFDRPAELTSDPTAINNLNHRPTITLPTWITLSRLLAVPIILVTLSISQSTLSYYIATAAFLLAALTDWLDGYLARKLDLVSDLGKFLDPLVDKLLVAAPLIMLVQSGQVPAWGVFVIFARELLVTAWRGIGTAPSIVPVDAVLPTAQSTGQSPSSSARFANQPKKVIAANLWGKAKTVVQIVAIAMLLMQLPGAIVVFWIAVILTIISGITYVLPTDYV
jgi:CDP-diacylglycerol--glycerol-3-phosphate 3-phosphatidyltransferase